MTAPVTSGAPASCGDFQSVQAGGRWELHLAGRAPSGPPLVITGMRLGLAPQLGLDELEHTIIRLLAPSTRWLIEGSATDWGDQAEYLFGLIAQAWLAGPEPVWSSGRLHLYRVTLYRPVAARYWEPEAPQTDQLDLVVWRDETDRYVLLNVYPTGAAGTSHAWASLPAALRSVVAVHAGGQLVGSGVVVGRDLVLTARHVVADRAGISVDGWCPVAAVVTVPLAEFGPDVDLATQSWWLARNLSGVDQGTVDLALLCAPGLDRPARPLRRAPVRPGEHLAVAGFPQGRWTVSFGPVTGAEGADIRALVVAGPGTSGGPAIDVNGEIAGILTMGHPMNGELLVGPPVLTSFVTAAPRIPSPRLGSDV